MSQFANQLKSAQQQRQGGAGLPPAMNAEMQNAFNQDFTGVRVHENKYQAGAGMGASAYTTGQQIAFAKGGYSPEAAAGRAMMGHELTHVVQQAGGAKK